MNSVTITWSNSSNTPPLKAVLTHLHAFQLARTLPSKLGLQNRIHIRLCPPKESDPLVSYFTVPRLPGYLANYDHECINSTVEARWGWKPTPAPAQPKTPPEDPTKIKNPPKGSNGLSVPSFAWELYKSLKSTQVNRSSSQDIRPSVWALDPESLRIWYTWPILTFLAKPRESQSIPATQLMNQISCMYGSIGERDLKNMPQAIQGALLILLPEYTNHRDEVLFNPTWWITKSVPRTENEILKSLIKAIERIRQPDSQLIIIHHQAGNPVAPKIVQRLAQIYGDKQVVSSTRVLPKTANILQTLQFIQKAAAVVADSRDPLAQVALLSLTQTPSNLHLLQDSLPYTTWELVSLVITVFWIITVIAMRAYYTHKHYTVPLHEHLKRFGLFTVLAFAPIIATRPSLWPESISSTIFMLYESGLQIIFYILIGFYSSALLITAAILAFKYYRKNKRPVSSEESTDHSCDEPLLPINQ